MRLLPHTSTPAHDVETEVDPTGRTGRVLIVDDEPNVRLVFRTALESAGFAVDEADDGLAALDWLAKFTADVVLLDIQMPGAAGMDVLRKLRDAGNDVPVVIITAHGSIPDAVAAIKLGAIDFLSKPLTPDVLRRVVSEVIDRHTPTVPNPEPATPETRPTVVHLGPPTLDLGPAKLALNRRNFDRAANLLEQALDADPDSPEALTLSGVLQESLGRDHAAYHAYRSALTIDPRYAPAQDNLRRYCKRFGLDPEIHGINPAAGS